MAFLTQQCNYNNKLFILGVATVVDQYNAK